MVTENCKRILYEKGNSDIIHTLFAEGNALTIPIANDLCPNVGTI